VTLEPDGQATGCNPVEVGSTPTGVFAITRARHSCRGRAWKERGVGVPPSMPGPSTVR
jgi:hypothetical protein